MNSSSRCGCWAAAATRRLRGCTVLWKLLQTTSEAHGSFSFLADQDGTRTAPSKRKMDHLGCFAPGMLALGVEEGIVQGDEAQQHMNAAKELMRTCFEVSRRSISSLRCALDLTNELTCVRVVCCWLVLAHCRIASTATIAKPPRSVRR